MILLCTNKPMHNGLLSPICPNDLRFLSKKNNSQISSCSSAYISISCFLSRIALDRHSQTTIKHFTSTGY